MTQERSQRALHAAQILWPAFLAAAVLEMVVFSWVDPSTLRWGDWQPDSQTTYSLSFLVFWAVTTVASLISHWMMKTPVELDDADVATVSYGRKASRRLQRGRQAQHHHA